MANKTFHIPEADEPMWQAAQRIANRRRTTVYRLVAEAMEDYLPRAAERRDRWQTVAADTEAA